MRLNKIDVVCLKDLKQQEKVSFIKALEIKDFLIVSSKRAKYNTVYKRLRLLENLGLINTGILSKNLKTYYITDKGIGLLNTIEKENNYEK